MIINRQIHKPIDKPIDKPTGKPITVADSVRPRRRFFTSLHRPCATSAGRSQCRAGWSRLWRMPLPRLPDGLNVLTMRPISIGGVEKVGGHFVSSFWVPLKVGYHFSGYFLDFLSYLMMYLICCGCCGRWYFWFCQHTLCMFLCWVCWSWVVIFSPERTLSI